MNGMPKLNAMNWMPWIECEELNAMNWIPWIECHELNAMNCAGIVVNSRDANSYYIDIAGYRFEFKHDYKLFRNVDFEDIKSTV